MELVCVSVYRTDSWASLQRLVFNMHDSDVAKFDDRILYNATLDDRTSHALYSSIRRQVARNFERANRSHKKPICRYCQVVAGPLNDYVAFVVFSETVELSTSARPGETVPSGAAADKSVGAEENDDLGKSRSKFRRACKEVSRRAVADRPEVKGQCREILGEIVQCKSEKKKELTPVSGRLPEPKGSQETTQTSRAGKQLAGPKLVDDDAMKDGKHGNLTGEVIGKTETDVSATPVDDVTGKVIGKIEADVSATPVDDVPDVEPVDSNSPPDVPDVEPVDSNSPPDEPERTVNQERLDVVNKQDEPKQSTLPSLPHRHEVVVEFSSSTETDAASELYAWNNDTELRTNLDDSTDVKNTEFKKLSDWLFLRISSTTAIHRFPTQYDLPVLGPRENPERSVTWRLAEKFLPSKSLAESQPGVRRQTHDSYFADVAQAGEQMVEGGKAASHVIFIGPYDASVIRHSEVVRRRVSQVCEDLLPHSAADILCITDVGSDVNVTRVSDIVDTSRLSATQFGMYTAMDPESAPVSCVLLKFNSSAE